MKHLFLIDPIDTFVPHKDTTLTFMTSVQHRDGEVWGATLDQLFALDGHAYVHATRYRIEMEKTAFYTALETETLQVDEFAVVWMRKDPPFDMQYVYATYLLDLVDTHRTLVLNRPQGLRNANEKTYILHFPEFTTDTAVMRTREDIRAAVDAVGGHAIIKPLGLMGGGGIFKLDAADGNFNSIVDAVTVGGTEHVMIQRYLPAAAEGDKRIILMDGRPLGAILRVPKGKDFRGNMAVGGEATPASISDAEHAMIEAMAPRLRAEGLYFVGLDTIGDCLTEVNVTSPTGIQEINRFDGVHIEEEIVGWAEAQAPTLA